MFWDGRGEQKGVLYLLPCVKGTETVPCHEVKQILYIVEEAQSASLGESEGYFVCCPDGTIVQAINDILKIYRDFLGWKNEIQHQAEAGHNLQRMLNISSVYLNMCFSLITSDYRVAASSLSSEELSWREMVPGIGRMTAEEIQQLYVTDTDFDKVYIQEGLVNYPYTELELFRLYYYNIRYHDVYLGRILTFLPVELDGTSARVLLEFLSRSVGECYCYCYEQTSGSVHQGRIYQNLEMVFQGDMTHKKEITKEFAKAGWISSQEYQVMKFCPAGHMKSGKVLEYFCILIESTFPSCLTIQRDGGILCLHNRSLCPDMEKFWKELPYFLRDNLFFVGISRTFFDYFNCALYALEAEEALVLGKQKKPSLWQHSFSHYTLEYILKKCTEDYPAKDLCHPVIEKLVQYDEKHPETELAVTLYQYILCRFNASKAAEALHIHRTTFLYRMRRIEQIVSLDLEDWNELMGIMLSYMLCPELKENGRQES